MRSVRAAGLGFAALMLIGWTARADDCEVVNSLLARGLSVVEVARHTGIPSSAVQACQREQGETIRIPSGGKRFGPAGPPPVGAAGPPPLNPAGPPPLNPAGPPPGQ